MDTKEKIAVMQAYIKGEEIECKPQKSTNWTNMDDCVPSDPLWNWEGCDYRIKPKPETLEDRIKAEYSDYDVVMTKEREESFDLVLNMPGLPLHINAQSMRGFYEYVYFEESEYDLYTDREPTDSYDGNTIQPVGVLFTRGKK